MTQADLRIANDGVGLPSYQRVVDANTYDTAGFPLYLKFDGVDDFLQTASVDFTATDKMSVFAAIRKLSDAATGLVAELSTSLSSTAGSCGLFAPPGANARYAFGTGGSADVFAETASVFPSPQTAVLSGVSDIAAATATLRVNGTQAASNSASQGTGVFGNYPLYIGRRGGTSLPFNGRLYSLLIRGAATPDATIATVESYLNQKARIY